MVFFGPIKFELIEALLICFATNNHSNFFKSISFNLVDESTAKIVSNLS